MNAIPWAGSGQGARKRDAGSAPTGLPHFLNDQDPGRKAGERSRQEASSDAQTQVGKAEYGGTRPVCKGLLGFAGQKVPGYHFWVLCCAANTAGDPRRDWAPHLPEGQEGPRGKTGRGVGWDGPREGPCSAEGRGHAVLQGSTCEDNR